jgi:hypothetical protein
MINKICGHCLKPFETPYDFKIYCCKKCTRNSQITKRRIRDKEWALKDKEKRRIRMIKYRKRCKEEGKCPRCGKPNDRLEIGYVECTNCAEQHRVLRA